MLLTVVDDEEKPNARRSRVLAELQQEEAALEAADDELGALLLRKSRFDIVMGVYHPPNPGHSAFKGPAERQVDVTLFAPVVRKYREFLQRAGCQLQGLPNLKAMGFVPYNPNTAQALPIPA